MTRHAHHFVYSLALQEELASLGATLREVV